MLSLGLEGLESTRKVLEEMPFESPQKLRSYWGFTVLVLEDLNICKNSILHGKKKVSIVL